MGRSLNVALLALACLALLPSAAHAQASIAGAVRDSSGGVLPGVTVEASSQALIEQVRSVVTDGAGQYKIIDLRPGTYTVTFTVTGFSSLKREGIELIGSSTATVNADLVVGSVAETVTVTTEAPTVDIQNTKQSAVITDEVIAALPTGRSSYNQAVLIPGVTLSTFSGANQQDVGGTQNMAITLFVVHGSRPLDQRLMINGLTLRHIYASSGSNFVPDMGAMAEVAFDYGSGTAEAYSAGVGMNLIPKEGGNVFRGSIFATGANGSFQANNYSDELKQAGLSSPNTLHRLYDINPSVGGPIFRNKLWFFGSMRWQESSVYQAGVYANKNGGDLTKWTYESDLTKRGESTLTSNPNGGIRLTWQATPRNKIAFSHDSQQREWIEAVPNASPEIYSDLVFHHNSFTTVTWSAPVTSRLLLDARFANHADGFADAYPGPNDPYLHAIPVRELATGFLYRGKGYAFSNSNIYFLTQNTPFMMQAQASASYVSGSHALKVGFQNEWGSTTSSQSDNSYGLFYQFQNGVPVSLEQHALPFTTTINLPAQLGIYAQDKWTFKRATVNAGLRFDYFKNSFPDQHLGPTPFTPNRDVTLPAVDYSNLKDITPRLGIAYDLFGSGRTSLKASWGKYLSNADAAAGNPITNLSYIAHRTWTPTLPANHPNYYTPQCDLLNPAENGDCGLSDNALFGKLTPSEAVDPQTYTGWGHRGWNQEFSVSVQHEIAPRVSVDVGYFRRWYGNFTVVQNRAVTASDFTSYSITAPVDSRLPASVSGQVIDGLLEVKPSKAGQVDNFTTFADTFGTQYEHWNGMDLSINARPRSGVVLQGGLSTGRTSTDNCDLRNQLPGITLRFGIFAIPARDCHVDTNFLTQVKFLGTYLVPKIDVQFGVTFQSAPGPQIIANQLVLPSQTTPVLPSFSAAGVRLINLVPPGTEYTERTNQLDLRFSKIFRTGRYRTSLNLDLANALNSNDVLFANSTYGSAWQAPLVIMDGRLVKISGQFDF